jgi:hypothetical protein
MPTWSSSSSVRRRAAVPLQDLADLLLDRVQRVERRHRLLEHHGDVVAADLAQLVDTCLQQILALEQDLAGGMRGRRIAEQPQDRQRGNRLARAGFAHQGHGLAGPDVEGHAVDREEVLPALGEGHGEVADG